MLFNWASLVAQLVKKPPAMRETRVRAMGWEDPLEKGTATHSSILAWGEMSRRGKPQRQKAHQCLPGTGEWVGKWRVIASGHGFSFWDDKNASGTSLVFSR